MLIAKTYQPKAKEIKRGWHLIDAKGKILGRVATEIARLLIGKHKATYAPHLDSGDNVVVINAKEVAVTGNKEKNKVYYSHSGYPGGLRAERLEEMRARNPKKIIELAVWNMLPKNRLRNKRITRLNIFAGNQHSYQNKFKVSK